MRITGFVLRQKTDVSERLVYLRYTLLLILVQVIIVLLFLVKVIVLFLVKVKIVQDFIKMMYMFMMNHHQKNLILF